MSEYCKNCFELAEKLTKKERECNTLKSQLDFAIQQKERFEQECEALKSEGFTRESLITEQENEIDELRQECEELKKQIKQLKDTINEEKEAGYSIIVDTDNPLNWTQEDFDEVIYDFVNTRVLSGQPIPPAINKWYCAVSQDIQKKRMGIVETTETDADRYRKALEEIERELKEDIYCESQECGCDDYEECLRCTKDLILDIINKAKGGEDEHN